MAISSRENRMWGRFEHSLDDKGRVIVPQKFREKLGEEFVLTIGPSRHIRAYPMPIWDAMEEQLASADLDDELNEDSDFSAAHVRQLRIRQSRPAEPALDPAPSARMGQPARERDRHHSGQRHPPGTLEPGQLGHLQQRVYRRQCRPGDQPARNLANSAPETDLPRSRSVETRGKRVPKRPDRVPTATTVRKGPTQHRTNAMTPEHRSLSSCPSCCTKRWTIWRPQPGETMLDATLGGGGHSAALAQRLPPGRNADRPRPRCGRAGDRRAATGAVPIRH